MRAMYYWAKCEIYNNIKDTKEPGRLLWPAYVFHEAQFFNSLTKFMMLNLPNDSPAQTASAKYSISAEIESHLPEGLLGKCLDAPIALAITVKLTVSKRPFFLPKKTPRENCKSKLSRSLAPLQKNAQRATLS